VTTTRAKVLAALRAAGEAGVSGEAIASTLGVSRVAVGKHVTALRAAGYEIDAAAGAGYRFLSAPDLPLPDEVAPLLRHAGFTLCGGGATGSTNDDAKALARDGAPELTTVLASRQDAGRGRLGRTWVSPPGGLYLSIVLRPPLGPLEVTPLSLVVALGVARGLEPLGARIGIKWPNDLRIEGAKLAGVLLEMSAEIERVEWAVVGVGINVVPPDEPHPGALYLREVVGPVPVAVVAAAALDGIADAYAAFLEGGFAPLVEEYMARADIIGNDVVVSDGQGTEVAAGLVVGVDGEGRLVLQRAGRLTHIVAGEVTLRR
jgi:BirA family biotin operon repressor/biotin-[acetyl-CoA-carboxylase] ligase